MNNKKLQLKINRYSEDLFSKKKINYNFIEFINSIYDK